MARDRVARLQKKTGINVLPIVIFVVVAAAVGAGLFTWDFYWRRERDAQSRPPSPEVIARNLLENIIGRGTVKESKVDPATGTATLTFESATFKPENPKDKSRGFISAEAELASSAVLDQLTEVKRVVLTMTHSGTTIATATADRGKKVQVTYVDPRLK